jgi:hypothetical protein
MPFDGTRMIYDQIPTDNFITTWEDLPGMNGYDQFTQEQLQNLPDVYSHQCRTYPLVPTKIDLEDKFNSFNLPVFRALEVKNSLLRPYQRYSVSGSLRYFKNEVFVIVLNGFENNTGDLTVQALTPTFGRNMLSMFTLTPDFVLHQEKQFFYTGGPLELGSVKPGASTTDMVTPVLIGLVPQISVDINSRLTPGAIMTNFTQGLPALQFSLNHLPSKLEFGFTSKVMLTTLEVWGTNTPSIVLNFGQAIKDLQLSLFTLNNKTITAPVMLRGTRSYVIPNFNQTFQAQGPVLMTYGIQIVDDVEQALPVEVVDSNIALEFSSVSQIVTGTGVEFISETSIIDILDFEDLFNEPD